METLKKQTNIRGDVKETVFVERNRQIFVETLKKQTNIGDVKETDKYTTLKKQTNIRGDVKETDKYPWRR